MSGAAPSQVLTVVWASAAAQDGVEFAQVVEAIEAQRNIPGVLSVRHGPRTSGADWAGPDMAFDYGMVLTFENIRFARTYVPHPIHQNLVDTILRSGSEERSIRGFWFDLLRQ
jgi:hypothetical protein